MDGVYDVSSDWKEGPHADSITNLAALYIGYCITLAVKMESAMVYPKLEIQRSARSQFASALLEK
jgi:hypothetical protein